MSAATLGPGTLVIICGASGNESSISSASEIICRPSFRLEGKNNTAFAQS